MADCISRRLLRYSRLGYYLFREDCQEFSYRKGNIIRICFQIAFQGSLPMARGKDFPLASPSWIFPVVPGYDSTKSGDFCKGSICPVRCQRQYCLRYCFFHYGYSTSGEIFGTADSIDKRQFNDQISTIGQGHPGPLHIYPAGPVHPSWTKLPFMITIRLPALLSSFAFLNGRGGRYERVVFGYNSNCTHTFFSFNRHKILRSNSLVQNKG